MEKSFNHNVATTDEIAAIIQDAAEFYIKDPEAAAHEQAPIMLRGAPGVGKSTIVKAAAKKLGINFVDVRLAQMERVDFSGLPSVKDGMTVWNVPAFWPRDPKSKGIILLDEISSAPSDCQVAAYSLVLDRRIPNSEYEVPNGWLIVAAGNRTCDRAVVKTMSSALANRFEHYDIEANSQDWIKWATQNDIHPAVTGFIAYRPELLLKMDGQNLEQGWPSPRSWEHVSHKLKRTNDLGRLTKNVNGLVGDGAGTEFIAFYKMSAQFDNVLTVMTGDADDFKMPSQADQKYAVASAAVYHLWNGKDEEETKARLDGFCKILKKMSNDFAQSMIQSAMLGNSKVTQMQAMQYLMSKYASDPSLKEKFRVNINNMNSAL